MIERWASPFRNSVAATVLMAGLGLASPVFAQIQFGPTSDPGAGEDVEAGATIVRGHYEGDGAQTDWEAAIRDGQPERVVEWRSYGADGQANVIFNFYQGKLMHYAIDSQRRRAGAGQSDGLVSTEIELFFDQGRYSRGHKTVDGRAAQPNDEDVRTAQIQADAALQRVTVAKPAWQQTQKGTTNFSMVTVPDTQGPSPETRRLAGEGEQIVFRCQDDSLFAILGAKADVLVVAPPGQDPAVLARQPRGSRYDYLGNGWAAERRGDDLRLEQVTGRAYLCHHPN
ncbi:MAG TPA: hypothetical protein VF194_03610 [Ferrovibrio sp.]|uniref:hypothetical protein n=1 Tax=Ferrovibrio sp. TaxID=1917215 RepID=UPI002ED0C609